MEGSNVLFINLRQKCMKPSTGLLLLAIVGGGIYFAATKGNVFDTGQMPEPEVVEVLPEWAEDAEAVEAAKAVLHKKALEAELNALESNFKDATATYNEEKVALEAAYSEKVRVYEEERTRLEKEIGTY